MLSTRIGHFALDLDRTLRPFLRSLEDVAQRLGRVPQELLAPDVLFGLRHATERLEALGTEIAERHGTIVVVGPSKSGKSTLINALARAYVTRVGDLPGVPALVSLTHAPGWILSAERWNGECESVPDPAAMKELLQNALQDLAALHRAAVAAGESFEPEEHAPHTLRRLDVRLPADALARTGLTLLEVPGDPRFRLDREATLRELAGRPAVALVVLRPRDLFLPTALEALAPLLERFESLHLVVNVDAEAREVDGGGELIPALQRTDPRRLLEAFEEYTPHEGWRSALASGRVQRSALDALGAARARLGGSVVASEERASARLEELERELVQALDRRPETYGLVSESLRGANALVDEISGLCQARALVELRGELVRCKDERTEALRQRDAVARLDRLGPREWEEEGAAETLRQALAARLKSRGPLVVRSLGRSAGALLATWFESEMSLKTLAAERLAPLFEGGQKEVAAGVRTELMALFETGQQPVELAPGTAEDFEAARLRFAEIARGASHRVDLSTSLQEIATPIRSEDVPVRKTLADRLLVRGSRRVRRRLFGPTDDPARELPNEGKTARLPEGAREELSLLMERRSEAFVAAQTERLVARAVELFFVAVTDELRTRLGHRRERLRPRLEQLERRVTDLESVRDGVLELERATKEAREGLERLAADAPPGSTAPSDSAESADSAPSAHGVPVSPGAAEVG